MSKSKEVTPAELIALLQRAVSSPCPVTALAALRSVEKEVALLKKKAEEFVTDGQFSWDRKIQAVYSESTRTDLDRAAVTEHYEAAGLHLPIKVSPVRKLNLKLL